MVLWDLFQQLQLDQHARRIGNLRRAAHGTSRTDAAQDRRLEALELDVARAQAMLAGLLQVLRDKRLVAEAEFTAAMETALRRAEAAAGTGDAAAAEPAPKPKRQRSSFRYRKA